MNATPENRDPEPSTPSSGDHSHDSATLASRVRKSIVVLQGRQAMILAINLVVGVILARELDPATFGLYGIATFCLSLITMAMDFGIGGSLIQRKGNFGDHELSVVFTLQTGISIVAAILVWFLAPLSLTVYKHASPDLVWIIRSLALPILFSPIGTVARLQLERSIQFHKVATIDIAALILSNVTILALVFTGHGVWSFVGGNIANALATTAASWFTVRYRPRLVIDRKLSRELFSFGMFFQFGNIANEAAGWIIPLIAGAGLGPAAVGLLTWSSSNARRPLMVVDNVMRVAFPHFSRLQTDPAALAVQVDHYFRRLLYLCYAWCFLAFVLGAPVTKLVYTEKWLPGVLPLQLFALGLAFDVANWVGGMTLTAIGGVKETAIFTLVKSLMAITGASVCVWWIGIIGIPIASMAASFVSGVFILIWLRKRVPYHFSQILLPAAPYLLGGLVFLPFAIAGGIPRLAAGWILGAAAIGWTGRVFYLEFVKNRPRDGLANQN